jgi:hypothetical protein
VRARFDAVADEWPSAIHSSARPNSARARPNTHARAAAAGEEVVQRAAAGPRSRLAVRRAYAAMPRLERRCHHGCHLTRRRRVEASRTRAAPRQRRRADRRCHAGPSNAIACRVRPRGVSGAPEGAGVDGGRERSFGLVVRMAGRATLCEGRPDARTVQSDVRGSVDTGRRCQAWTECRVGRRRGRGGGR